MPIPFRVLGEEEHAGVAGYLRFIDDPGGMGVRGALFIMSTRGEPLEFCFTRIAVPTGIFWRADHAKSRAIASLAKALFEATDHTPQVVLILADEAPPGTFTEKIQVAIPLCQVVTPGCDPLGQPETLQQIADSPALLWVNGPPAAGGDAAKTVDVLRDGNLLLEPFGRAALGLQEAFEP